VEGEDPLEYRPIAVIALNYLGGETGYVARYARVLSGSATVEGNVAL
jgi:hypothetical protein